MSAQPPEGTQPATLVLGDEQVEAIAAAVVDKLLHTKVPTNDAPGGRYLQTLFRGAYDGTQRLIRKAGA